MQKTLSKILRIRDFAERGSFHNLLKFNQALDQTILMADFSNEK